jgi:hypothetical protein
MAQNWASQPFSAPAAPVAGLNPFQNQAFGQIQGMQGGLQPYFQNAGADMTRGEAPVTQAETASYMNPYADQALAAMKKYVFDPQRVSTTGSAVQSAGGVGADRLALTSQNLDKTQADAVGTAQAGFYGQALSAAQEAKQRALQSAQGWANLGLGNQSGQLQGTQALLGAGNQQQAQTQRELMSPYEQTLARIAYPGQMASFLSGITGDMSNVFKGTTQGQSTTTNQAATPSMFNQIAGLGMAGAGLMMGNPMMAMGGLGSMGGGMGMSGGAGSGYNPNTNMPLWSSDGQRPLYAAGGSVNPWDMGQGFAPGGDVEEVSPDEYNRIDDQLARPIEGPAPNLGMWPFNRGMADASGNVTMYPEAPAAPMPPATAPPIAPQQNPYGVPPNAGTLPMPGAYRTPLPPAIPTPAPQPTAVAQRPQPPDRIGGYGPRSGGINSDMKISDFEMPRENRPYPDATDRDWGQNLARSPWMSLIHAGLKTAQSTKSGAAGLAEGLEAGATHLDVQRKELRSEQQINQRAEELYRHARSELNKYTRKTPHELATEGHQAQALAQGRFQPINYPDPVTGQLRMGNYDAKRGILIDSVTRQPVTDAVRLLGRNAGLPMTEAQIEMAAKNRFVNEPGKYASIDEAREAVKKQIQAAQTTGASQPGSTAESAIPDPGDGNRVSGTWYINPATGKPDRWR